MSDGINITPKDLEKIISGAVKAAVEEAKKPYVSDQDKARMEQEQVQRKQNADLIKEEAANKQRAQLQCSHHRRDGTCRAVYVQDENNGYMLCQKCGAVIRSGDRPKKATGSEHYNTDLFNRLFQASSPTLD